MFLYISENRKNELKQYFCKIVDLFPIAEQCTMQQFLSELDANGGCFIETYNNVYSILNCARDSIETENQTETKNKSMHNHDKVKTCNEKNEQIEVLELLRLQFATKYYFTQQVEQIGQKLKIPAN